MIGHIQIATFFQGEIKSNPVVYTLMGREVVRQFGGEKHFRHYFRADVKVYSIQENGNNKAVLICYYFKMNEHITVFHNVKTFYEQGEDLELYKFVILAFLKELTHRENVILADKKFEHLM